MTMIPRTASRILLGVVFIFSGFVKAVDPLGSAYKFGDYFESFHIDFLSSIALPLALILSSLEFIIGFSLLLGVRMKLASRLVTIFMVFFTLLTLYIAIKNPVTDCGCFGDALILTNWQTFWKNVGLMVLITIVYLSRNEFVVLFNKFTEWSIVLVGIIFIVSLSVYCLRHLPIIDFRPYNIGTYIPEKMIIPEDAPADQYITYLNYEKDGEVKEFNDQEYYPWDDSTWTYVESRSELVKKGYTPPIHDFSITSTEGEDITDMILQDQNYSLLLICYDIEKANKQALIKFNDLRNNLINDHYSFYCLTSSTQSQIDELVISIQPDFNFYASDEITLKTIIRSNPGLVLIKEGIIVDKWHYNDWPEVSELEGNAIATKMTKLLKETEKVKVYIMILYGILFLSIFKLLRPFFMTHK